MKAHESHHQENAGGVQERPKEVQQAFEVLDEIERMTAAVTQAAGLRPEHHQWLERMRQCWARCDRGMAALAIVAGPMDDFDDGVSQVAKRRCALASAVVEAALIEQSPRWPWDAARLRQSLLQWLALGSWCSPNDGALAQIGRMIEQDSDTARDALAVRLGLLSSFWAGLALWLRVESGEK